MILYLNIVQIFVSLALIIVIGLQAKGSAFSGAMGTDSSVYSSRRGFEKTLFQITIGLAVLFVVISIVSVYVAKSSAGVS